MLGAERSTEKSPRYDYLFENFHPVTTAIDLLYESSSSISLIFSSHDNKLPIVTEL